VTRILFVCLGNICRSPTAEAVMVELVERAGLADRFEIDSAGTGNWHVGEPPDARAAQAARARGIELRGTARQVAPEDFDRFDLIIAMDRSNLANLAQLAEPARLGSVQHGAGAELRLLREFESAGSDASSTAGSAERRQAAGGPRGPLDVPDPYHGGPEGFDRVLDMVRSCCEGLLAELSSEDGATPRPVTG
jgi:protein-tyrosine phosphatase